MDLGVSGARAAVVDLDGTVAGSGRAARHDRPGSGLGPQDPGQWIADVLDAARRALDQAAVARVEAIAVAALGPAPVPVDASLRPLMPACLLSLDPRLEERRIRLLDALGLDAAAVPPGHPVPQLLWWQEHAPAWGRASMVLDATGFLVSALTGVPTMDTVTALDYSVPGLACPVSPPEAMEPGEIAGGLAEGPAADLGLPAGARVLVVEPIAERRQLARAFGAQQAVSPEEWRGAAQAFAPDGFAAAIIAIGKAGLVSQAIEAAAPGGRVVAFAGFGNEPAAVIDMNRIHYGEVELVGSHWVGTPPKQRLDRYAQARDLLASPDLYLERLVTRVIGFEPLEDALVRHPDHRELKTVLIPGQPR